VETGKSEWLLTAARASSEEMVESQRAKMPMGEGNHSRVIKEEG
jgi:hypothetical protein